jgi:hypothetical protein
MKKYKKILASLLALSFLSIIAGLVISFPVEVGVCPQPKSWQDISCIKKFPAVSVGSPLVVFPVLPLFIFIILFFAPESFFNAWRRFALIFGLISVALIIITPVYGSGIVSIGKDYVTWATSILFFIISLCIIFYQAIKYNRNKGLKK